MRLVSVGERLTTEPNSLSVRGGNPRDGATYLFAERNQGLRCQRMFSALRAFRWMSSPRSRNKVNRTHRG
jgi:hypothetical protein